MLAGIRRAAEAVFGREYVNNVDAAVEHDVESVAVAHHARVVAEEGHALAAQCGQIFARTCCRHYYLRRFCLGRGRFFRRLVSARCGACGSCHRGSGHQQAENVLHGNH